MATGRFVLVEYDDGEEANKLIAAIKASNGVGSRIIGIFERPDDPCVCKLTIVNGETQPPWMEVKQLGWWLCTGCLKPRSTASWLRNQVAEADILNPNIVMGGVVGKPRVECAYYANSLALLHSHISNFRR